MSGIVCFLNELFFKCPILLIYMCGSLFENLGSKKDLVSVIMSEAVRRKEKSVEAEVSSAHLV